MFHTALSLQKTASRLRAFCTFFTFNLNLKLISQNPKSIHMASGNAAESSPGFDVYSSSARELQGLLETGKLTSVDLVSAYLDQIEKHNMKGFGLRAVLDPAPRQLTLEQARSLDKERATNGSRGPLHGIPLLVKVVVDDSYA